MVENPATTLSSELTSAKVVDETVRKRAQELATKGKDSPESLTRDDVEELCTAVLTLI